nr:T-cell receptor V region beta-chain, TCR V beta {colony 4-2} [mice, NOD, intrathyroidal T cells, Peptide Partial, 18 aa] [Mus sp.]
CASGERGLGGGSYFQYFG